MIKKILYATDLGIYGPYLMQHVMMLAARFDSEIVVVHAVEPLGIFAKSVIDTYLEPSESEAFAREGFDAVLATIRERVMDAFQEEFSDDEHTRERIAHVYVDAGKPVDVILNRAADEHADLIVVGSHSQNTESAGQLGTVAGKLLQLSDVPIYMVPILDQRAAIKRGFAA
jgi:nucleotide-binding universal stress UspA family protein